jgi:hypothetical protein
MCMTSASAKLTKTLLYAGEGIRNDKQVHVLAYQNNAINDAEGPNAMILPFPAVEEMTEQNVINTKPFKSFLKDIANATKMRTLGMDSDLRLNATKGMSRGFAKVFDSGSYTVVLAENVDQIPEALTRVPTNKRPTISDYFLHGFGQLYPNQPIAVCCWDGEIEAEPLLWWYEPKNKDHLFVPTMDAHDGKPPRLTEAVQTDHIISIGAVGEKYTNRQGTVRYTQNIPTDVVGLLPEKVYGTKLGSTYRNGDMFFATQDLYKKIASWKDIPKISRGVSFAEASIQGTQFEMYGWG